jgi:V/A-type H+/Na+-transporting ATPase subunit D
MMTTVHPTRTNLLLLREKHRSVFNSIAILKARRQALIREFLAATLPFLRSREEIRKTYARALAELALSRGLERKGGLESLTALTRRDFPVNITEKSVWGLAYRDIEYHETPLRKPEERGYDWRSTTPHVEESITLFEKIFDAMLQIAAYESKIKRLGDEILRTTRRVRVLEERVLPDVAMQIRSIAHYIGEREREAFYRLKRFKED